MTFVKLTLKILILPFFKWFSSLPRLQAVASKSFWILLAFCRHDFFNVSLEDYWKCLFMYPYVSIYEFEQSSICQSFCLKKNMYNWCDLICMIVVHWKLILWSIGCWLWTGHWFSYLLSGNVCSTCYIGITIYNSGALVADIEQVTVSVHSLFTVLLIQQT